MKAKVIKFFRFIGISGLGWIIDMLTFTFLTYVCHINVGISNVISSFLAVSFVFTISTRKIFKNSGSVNLIYKYVFYLIYQVIIISCSSFVIVMIKDFIISLNIEQLTLFCNIIAKIIVTPFTMIINYFAMSLIVEKI